MVRVWTEIFMVSISWPEEKTITRGCPYKFSFLNSPKINTLWENCHHFFLAYKNLTTYKFKKRKSKDTIGRIFRLKGYEYQSFIRCNLSQLNSLKIRVFKGTLYWNLYNFWLGDPFAVIQKVEEIRMKGKELLYFLKWNKDMKIFIHL